MAVGFEFMYSFVKINKYIHLATGMYAVYICAN